MNVSLRHENVKTTVLLLYDPDWRFLLFVHLIWVSSVSNGFSQFVVDWGPELTQVESISHDETGVYTLVINCEWYQNVKKRNVMMTPVSIDYVL